MRHHEKNMPQMAFMCLLILTLIGIIGSMLHTLSNSNMQNEPASQELKNHAPLVANASISSDQSGDEWPMFRAALNHTGVVMTTPVQGSGPLWNYTTGDFVWSSPAVVNGCVYVGSSDRQIYCLNAITGQKIWNHTLGGPVWSSPAVAGGYVYVGSDDCNIYCLNANTGTVVWNYTTGGVIGQSSPAVAGGRVYVGSEDHNIYCLNAITGAKLWNYKANLIMLQSPAISSGFVYMSCGDSRVYCFNAITGARLWNSTTGDMTNSSVAVSIGRVYVGSDDGNVYCLNATTGAILWNQMTSYAVRSSPAIFNGRVYVGNDNGMVYCLNAITGAKIWNYITGNGIWSSPAVANGYVYVGGEDQNLYCLNATNGLSIWNYNIGGPMFSSPAVSGGRVYVGGYDSRVYCFPMALTTTQPSAPQNLQAICGDRQVILSWQAPVSNGGSIITGYNVYRGTTHNGETLLISLGVVFTFGNFNLTNGQTYYFEVTAVNFMGESAQSSELGTIPCTVPNVPTLNSATPSAGQVQLVWAAPAFNGGSGITGYNVYQGTTTGGETLLVNLGVIFNYTSSNLTNGQIYYFKITAVNVAGESVKSNELGATPLAIPTQPINLTAMGQSTQITLNWTAPASNGGVSISSYKIYVGTTSGGESLNHTVSGNVFGYVIMGMVYNKQYFFEVSAVNSKGEGPRTPEVMGIPSNVPSAPRSFTVTAGVVSIMLNWVVPLSNGGFPISNYRVYQGTTSGGEKLLATIGVVFTYTATGLTSGHIYYFTVAAVNSQGPGANATEASATPTKPLISSDQLGDEWPMFHGALNHTGTVNTIPLHGSQAIWSYATGGPVHITAPAISAGRMYVGSNDFDVYCLNATTGTFIWSYTTGGAVTNTPAVAGGCIYVGSDDYKLYCLNASTGAKIWSYTTGSYMSYSSPAVWNGRVYAGSIDDYIYCLNASNGVVLWSYLTYGSVSSPPAIAGGSVYFGSDDHHLYCLNAMTGAFRWSYSSDDIVNDAPAIAGGRVYFGCYDNKLYCLDASSGTFIWSFYTDYSIGHSSPAVAGGRVYFGSWDKKIYCLDATSGNKIWSYTTGDSVFSSPAVASGFVYVGSDDDNLYCLNATTGAFVWDYATGKSIYSSASIANGMVYVGSDDNKIYCFPMISTTVPTVPQALTVSESGNRFITLTWTQPASNCGSAITGYRIYRGTSSGAETFLINAGNVTTFNSTGLTNGQKYFFYVAAVNAIGTSANSNEASATPNPIIAFVKVGSNAPLYYVPVNLTNSQGSSTPAYFQQKIIINPSANSAIYASNLDNVNWQDGNNTILSSWLESGASSSSTSTIYWINLGSNIIAANGGKLTIYEAIYATSVNVFNNINTGAYPWYTGTYGQYDDAMNVFQARYNNFAGTTFPNGFSTLTTPNGQFSYSVNNGLTLSGYSKDNSNQALHIYAASPGNYSIVEMYLASAALGNGGNGASIEIALNTSPPSTSGTNDAGFTNCYRYDWYSGYYRIIKVLSGIGLGGQTYASTLMTPAIETFIWSRTGNQIGQSNYTTMVSGADSSIIFQNSYIDVGLESNVGISYSSTFKIYWLRSRLQPPNGVMPSTSFGSLKLCYPSAPQNLQATGGNGCVVLTWQKPTITGNSAITGYKIYQGTTSNGETLFSTIGNVTTYTTTGLTNGQVYYFKVAAVNAMGTGSTSTETSAIPATVPKAPQRLSVPAMGIKYLLLTWTKPPSNGGSPITGYCIYRGMMSSSEILIATIGNVTMYNDSKGFINGQAYFYEVAAINAKGTGTLSYEMGVIITTSPLNSDQMGDNWPMFHGALNHTGVVTTTPVQGNGPSWNYTTGWCATSNGMYSSPAVAGGRVYVGSNDSNIYCFDATTGALDWTYTTGGSVHSSPAVAGGCVYVGSNDHNVYCLNATTGMKIWNYSTADEVEFSSAAVTTGRVYVGSNDQMLYCLNASTGALLWSFTTVGPVHSSPAIAGGRVYVGSDDGNLYCLNAYTGSLIWYYNTYIAIYSSPAIADGRVYVGIGNQKIYCFDASTGALVWSYATSYPVDSSPAVAYGRVYTLSDDGSMYCLEATTGAFLWSSPTRNSLSSPAVVDGYVYVGSCCLDATTGTLLWSYTPGNGIWGSPAVAGGQVYVESNDHKLYCLPMELVPTVPRNLLATGANKQVTLTWQAPANNWGSAFTGYKIYRGTVPGHEVLVATVGNVLTWNETGLMNGQTYYYVVAAVNGIGTGANSTEASAIAGTPGAPVNLLATAGTANVALAWQAPLSNGGSAVTGYKIYQGTSSGGETLRAVLGNVVTWNDTGLTHGQVYYFKIAAMNAMGMGPNATEVIAIPGLGSDPAGDAWPMFHGALNHAGMATTTPVQGTEASWSYTTGSDVYSSPAVAGGRVYVGGDDGKIYCLNATTGTFIWSYTTGSAVYSSPAVASDRVYIESNDGNLYCLSALTGALVWSYMTGGSVPSSPAVAGWRVYVGSYDRHVYCLDAITGILVWSYMTGGSVSSSPAVVGGRVYVGSDNDEISCIDAITGMLSWSYTTSSIVSSSPAVAGGCVYVGSDDGNVYCLSAYTGAIIWIHATGGRVCSSPAIASGCVYVGSDDHDVYCLDAITGTLMWSRATGAQVESAPAVAGGRVYVGSLDHDMYCFPMNVGPDAPQNIQASCGTSQIILTWQAPPNGRIQYYKIYRSTSPGKEIYYMTTRNMTVFTDANVNQPGQKYYYQVSAVSTMGEGPRSIEASAFLYGVPTAPRDLQASVSNGHVALTWLAPANNGGFPITNYTIYRVASTGSETCVIGNASTYVDTAVVIGQVYYYTVSATNGIGEGPQSTEVSAIPAFAPGVPRNFTETAGIGQIILTWQVPTNNGGAAIIGYKIYRGTSVGADNYYTTIDNVTIFTDTGVVSGQTYYYTIVAINGAGEGSPSSEMTARLAPTSPPTSLPSSVLIIGVGTLLFGLLAICIPVAFHRSNKQQMAELTRDFEEFSRESEVKKGDSQYNTNKPSNDDEVNPSEA